LNRDFAQDEIIEVTTPGGAIDGSGVARIAEYVYFVSSVKNLDGPYWAIHNSQSIASEEWIEPEWVTRAGNYPKRLQKWLYQHNLGKLSAQDISQIGNIAKQHTSQAATHLIAVTRDLNQPADQFVNGGSCWWTDYSASRCILKQCGGLAIRSFTNGYLQQPISRAWIVPLGNDLHPTQDAHGAKGYVLFNAYGFPGDGYGYARLLAQLTAKYYRRITFVLYGAYVNGNIGYLVADPDLCQTVSEISLDWQRTCRCR
jgi:hypothetical protein